MQSEQQFLQLFLHVCLDIQVLVVPSTSWHTCSLLLYSAGSKFVSSYVASGASSDAQGRTGVGQSNAG